MKTSIIVLFALLHTTNLYTQTSVSGRITDEIWTLENSPYRVVGDISVVTLEIQPGVNVQFDGNYIFEVAGILIAEGTEQDSIVFTKTDSVNGWQGILFNFSPPGSKLAYCKIENSTNRGIVFDHSSQTLRNCTIVNNSSIENGGGIYISTGSTDTLNNCKIVKNNSTKRGGGIWVDSGGTITLNNCTIADNLGDIGAGIGVGSRGTMTLTNCIIARNIASNQGGGIYVAPDGNVNLTNCTVVHNTTWGIESFGTATVKNSIIFFNTGDEIHPASATVTYSNVQNGYQGIGNINLNPVFLDDSTLTLANISPCIDAGDPDSSFFDTCFPPSQGTERNDLGVYGGPGACAWLDTTTTAVNDFPNQTIPVLYQLDQNYPNPFNPTTTISYTIPRTSKVILRVFDLRGIEIETLVNERQKSGTHSIKWDALGLPSGLYIYRLEVDDFMATKKLMLLK